ncbi:PilZ domain-containing protein [Rhodanobacter terrae]|uniref:PilZ domain-containing protein n=1 Tax=Rhodanobacter terrae TaxID=418647 RepID=A0ABW0SYU4_9GAMM
MNRTDHDHQRDERRAQRKSVDVVTEVTDVITGLPMGQIGNVSGTGMLLIGPAAPRSEAIYQLRLPLPGSSGSSPYIEVGVQEQWHEHAASADQFWAGYRIISITEENEAQLQAWLALPA